MRLRGILLALALSGSLSCGNAVTGPFQASQWREDIRLGITASPTSGSPTEPVTIRKVVRNAGKTTVLLATMCGEPTVWIHDEAGSEFLLRDPTIAIVCPSNPFLPPLEPGSSWESTVTFDGRHYSSTGEHLDAAPGTYKATVRFSYFRDPYSKNPQKITLTREVFFTWQ
jgi:hypothetical protein